MIARSEQAEKEFGELKNKIVLMAEVMAFRALALVLGLADLGGEVLGRIRNKLGGDTSREEYMWAHSEQAQVEKPS